MKTLTVSTSMGNKNFELTLTMNVDEDLSAQDVAPRIMGLLDRECTRIAEIVTVALKDETARLAAPPLPPGERPAVILAAGTKDPVKGRVVVRE